MEKYEFEQELKEAVLIKRADKSIALVLDGEEVEISCPKLCSMNINEEGVHVWFLIRLLQRMGNIQSWLFH